MPVNISRAIGQFRARPDFNFLADDLQKLQDFVNRQETSLASLTKTVASTASATATSTATTAAPAPAVVAPAIPQTVVYPVIIGRVNIQTTDYTVTSGDSGELLLMNSPSPHTVTLPDPASVATSFVLFIQDYGAGALTVTPAAGQIDGASSLVLAQSEGIVAFTDGTNWYTERGIGSQSSSIAIPVPGIDGLDADEPMMIPGAQGPQGNPGATGPAGPMGLGIDGLDGEDAMGIPGPQGPAGSGGAGVSSLDGITGAVTLNAGANITITDNSPTAGKITIAAAGGGGSPTLAFFRTPYAGPNASGPPAANAIELTPFTLEGSLSASRVGLNVITASAAVTGDFGIYDTSGTLLASIGGFAMGAGGVQEQLLAGGPIVISAGTYYAAWTQTDTSGRVGIWNIGGAIVPLSTTRSTTNATAGVLPASIVIPAAGITNNVLGWLAFTLR